MTDFLWTRPDGTAAATLLLAHGAGAAMDSPFMNRFAKMATLEGIAVARGVAAPAEECEGTAGDEGIAGEALAEGGGALTLGDEVDLAEDLFEGLGDAGVDDALLPVGKGVGLR